MQPLFRDCIGTSSEVDLKRNYGDREGNRLHAHSRRMFSGLLQCPFVLFRKRGASAAVQPG
ncbi:MAG TPA: hypothetical protein DCX60_08130 [Phycisphaerales bacterium]|nr:hypothetical protein [Phycisphaerales bacterium]